ncbi:MAG TPA: hypothetical protein VMB72_05980 [Acidimicrobiales bacterium]|nr:hypothetical protein [Acidimicrobiales bacterium]
MAGTTEASFPPGPWVLVLGMHRSGTSALTGALGCLGLALPAPDDLVRGRYDNPVHYESAALTAVGDDALAALGGSWSAPPPLDPGWEGSPALAPLVPAAAAAARRAFPGRGPVLWKDPRLCLLLPWWRGLLPAPVATVLLWRRPGAVARSLAARQGFPVSLGLALWHRYTQAALAALAGSAAYVVSYEGLLADPPGTLGPLRAWLDPALGTAPAGAGALEGAAATVTGDLAHHGGDGDGDGEGESELPEVVQRAVALLAGLEGAVEPMPAPAAVAAPAWMADAVTQRRQYEELYARYMRYVRLRRRIPFLGRRVGGGPHRD